MNILLLNCSKIKALPRINLFKMIFLSLQKMKCIFYCLNCSKIKALPRINDKGNPIDDYLSLTIESTACNEFSIEKRADRELLWRK